MAKPTIHNELVICVDFDGTITTDPGFSEDPLELQLDCKEILLQMHRDGIRLVLWTCRTDWALDAAIEFLKKEGLYHIFDKVNEQCDEVTEAFAPYVSRKLGADVYLDDKNLGASYIVGYTEKGKTIIDWEEIRRLIYGD